MRLVKYKADDHISKSRPIVQNSAREKAKVFIRKNQQVRSSDETKICDKRSFKIDTAKKGFITRTINDWNNLPRHLREIPNLKQFKFKLKSWVKDNIPIK